MSTVDVVEVLLDDDLQQKTHAATVAFRCFFADAPELRLYRTADGRLGFQAQVADASGDRVRFKKAYRAVMNVLCVPAGGRFAR